MRRLAHVAALAALATGGLAVVAPAAGEAAPAHAAVTVTLTLPTKIPNVHIRSVAHSGAGSKVVATVAAAGTPLGVSCFVVTSGKYWFQTVTPAGFVAARNLAYSRPHGAKVPSGLPACAA
ncbi:MAG TPA: hypothetical protein VJT31_08475 [Rugosimonospora sp.]|nr:hypothetical protein [Rugosimonospora sp.]